MGRGRQLARRDAHAVQPDALRAGGIAEPLPGGVHLALGAAIGLDVVPVRDSHRRNLEAEAVDVHVVRPEPIAEAAVRDADGPEHLLTGADRRGQRLLHVLEEDLPACDRGAVELRGSPVKPTREVAPPRRAASR